jgi:capsular polysaccharide biosynthesis protein
MVRVRSRGNAGTGEARRMNEQPLNVRKSLQILRQHWIAAGLIVLLGLVAGVGFAAASPPLYSDTALVVLSSSTRTMTTQALIADSNPVLAGAARRLHPAMSVQTLSSHVQVTTPIVFVLSISAEAGSAAQATDAANAVADSYVAYVNATSNATGKVSAQVLHHAASASKTWLLIPMLTIGGIGALAGLLVGTIAVLAVYRDNRRLRRRDEIADAIGVAVLASVPVLHPRKAHHWTRLLDGYEPGAADVTRLRSALNHLGLADLTSADTGSERSSVTVVSLTSDWRALALGPQLAVFAAAQGIPTALVVSPRPDLDTMAELRAACVASPSTSRSKHLRVAVTDHGSPDWPDPALTVVVAVVDSRRPDVADLVRTDSLVLGVSTGAATAAELARVAASTVDGRYIAGILMADPDPADPTTGRLPQLGPGPEVPARVPGRVR